MLWAAIPCLMNVHLKTVICARTIFSAWISPGWRLRWSQRPIEKSYSFRRWLIDLYVHWLHIAHRNPTTRTIEQLNRAELQRIRRRNNRLATLFVDPVLAAYHTLRTTPSTDVVQDWTPIETPSLVMIVGSGLIASHFVSRISISKKLPEDR